MQTIDKQHYQHYQYYQSKNTAIGYSGHSDRLHTTRILSRKRVNSPDKLKKVFTKCALLLLTVLVVFIGCEGEQAAGTKSARKSASVDREQDGRMSPREGVRRGLLKMQASLNHRNAAGYLDCFSGNARKLVGQTFSKESIEKLKGRFFLHKFDITPLVKGGGHNSPVGVHYQLRQEWPNGRREIQKHKAVFAPAPKKKHWVIISIGAQEGRAEKKTESDK